MRRLTFWWSPLTEQWGVARRERLGRGVDKAGCFGEGRGGLTPCHAELISSRIALNRLNNSAWTWAVRVALTIGESEPRKDGTLICWFTPEHPRRSR